MKFMNTAIIVYNLITFFAVGSKLQSNTSVHVPNPSISNPLLVYSPSSTSEKPTGYRGHQFGHATYPRKSSWSVKYTVT